MWILFLDEFGDFSLSDDPANPSWRPICGYAGFLIPSENYREFCDAFTAFRIIGTRNVVFARKASQLVNSQIGLSYQDFLRDFDSGTRRFFSKSEEAKGSKVFSTSYVSSGGRPHRKRKHVIRFAKRFLRLIEQYGGEVFFYGVQKSVHLAKRKTKTNPRSLHVDLVRGVLDCVFYEAKERKSQIKLIFDHHGVDDGSIQRLKAKSTGEKVSADSRFQTRQEYAQEVILEKRYGRYIKEPLFHMQSHWSLGIQAADWVCALLGKTKSYQAGPEKFTNYTIFAEKLGDDIDGLLSRHSNIVGLPRTIGRQASLLLR